MFQQFLNQVNGKYVDFDGVYGFQCFDLVNKWSTTLGYRPFGGLYAYGIFDQPQGNYSQIKNTPDAVPQAGDIIVWNSRYGGGYGHTAIATGTGNTSYFESLDQNYPTGSPAHIVRHSYDGVIGWLRPNKLTTGDNDMVIQGENEFARANKLHQQLLGVPLSREVFNQLVGKSWLNVIEIFSDHQATADQQAILQVGRVAVKDKWQQQIYDLQAQLKKASDLATDLNNRLVKAEADTKTMTAKVEALEKKVSELDNKDNIVVSRSWFNTLFDKIKSFINKG